ncbi:aminotransferase class III-fold pyridoxal phosphate-dependent enzyme [Paraburkholderia madseniana]|uniref:Aminotransferase class III-fold pyridoxal phosphate-dependent enzyme n=1 Tax=Paraburkholderia madseniana TaxID=2599607 RepID=A0A6N6VYJ5_9BURK|nr:aminotransferase class III-fold pyridoxal phosphate-dependent enzyme [Paraburkholderia madseniana]KAE8753647.1 aminotransferase class III-fold pyridoxal phosphate-dependent enzyme [Paraburkholderia madseniana]
MVWTNTYNKALLERAQQVIPGGMYGHMSTSMLPAEFPQFFRAGKGARTWDVDGNEYVDFMCAYGPNLLGYNEPTVEAAVTAQRELGDALNGPGEVMVDLAERFVSLVNHASWTMFAKNGTDVTSAAMVIARVHTGKRIILAATDAYHGAAPWCVPIMLSSGTIPEDRASIVYYDYNDPQSLTDAFREHKGNIAGVFATPFKHDVFRDQEEPDLEYAQTARRLCTETGALLIVDDIRAGFRLARDCSWSLIGVEPDLSCWGKCFANGHPISALLGSEQVRAAAKKVFITGSFWFSAIPMAAGIATLQLIRDTDYLERLKRAGQKLRDGLDEQARSHGFELRQTGPVQMPQILFEDDPDFRIGYAWAAECVVRGAYLHPYHNMFLSAAHSDTDIKHALAATDGAFEAVKRKLPDIGPVVQLSALV